MTPEKPARTPRSERPLIEAALGQAAAMGDGALNGFNGGHTPRPSGGTRTAPIVPAETFPGYDVLREIHRGGQGVVYLAVQRATKRRVAVKVMHGGAFAGSAGRTRFEREVQVLGQLNHPNIVRIHDSGTTADGGFFYVMDYVSGRPLDELFLPEREAAGKPRTRTGQEGEAPSPPPTNRAETRARAKTAAGDLESTLRLFAKICDGVNAAHLKGVIHRDLKPANIRIDTNGEPVIVDFGLAKIAAPDVTDGKYGEEDDTPQVMTMTGQFIGSLPWASPEQAKGSPGGIDLRTDVYSLGVILYQMLTGKFPYQVVGNMRDVLDNILRAEPARPSTIRRQINDEVETIVLKCLSKERERRYQSAGELGRDIQRYLRGEPIEAKRDSGWYVLTKTLNRYRIPAAIAGAFFLLVIASGTAMAFMYVGERSARHHADQSRQAAEKAQGQAVSERDRANENFAAVRALARTFIFDFYDKIEKLRGATRAKEQLAKEAAAYLAKLEPQAPDDPALAAEIASAYDRVGDILGGLYMPKRGETAAAAASYAKARQIRERLRDQRPDDASVRAGMGKSYLKSAAMLNVARDFPGAQAECDRAITEYATARRLAGAKDDAAGRALLTDITGQEAETLKAIGDLYHNMAEAIIEADRDTAARYIEAARSSYAQAEADWQKRLVADAADAKAVRYLPVLLSSRAAGRSVLGSVAAGRAKDAAKKADPGAAKLFEDALGLFREAEQMALQAAAETERLSAAQPASAELRRDLYLEVHNAGQALMLAAEAYASRGESLKQEADAALARQAREAAKAHYERALLITEGLARSDEANREALRDIYVCLNKLGNMQLRLGERERAVDSYTRSLAIRDDIVLTDETQQHHMDRAVGRFKLASVQVQLAGDAQRNAADRKARLTAAIDLCTKAIEEFRALVDAGVLREDSGHIKEVTEKMDAARQALTQLGP